ncbi:14182_t:CDS:1, partial [Acaulospora colombiana]
NEVPSSDHLMNLSVAGSSTILCPHTKPLALTSTPSSNQWMSAEDEKARLRYLEAKRAVDKHTALQDEQFASTSSGGDYGGASYGSSSSYFAGNQSSSQSYASPPVTGTSTSDYAPSSVPPRSDALSPSAFSSSHVGQSSISMATTPTPPPPSDLPAFEPSFGYTHATDLPEKEKMRLAYEARDVSVSPQAPPDYAVPPPGPYPGEPPQFGTQTTGAAPPQPLSAAEEKARLRAQYALEQVSASQNAGASSSAYNPPPSFEPALSADGTRTLTAAEEKARLQALQAADKPVSATPPLPPPRIKSPPLSGPPSAVSEVNRGPPLSYTPSISASMTSDDYLQRDPSITQGKQRAVTPSTETMPGGSPPPLAPRPPKEYIQQTKDQDARVRRMTQEAMNIGFSMPDGGNNRDSVPWQMS